MANIKYTSVPSKTLYQSILSTDMSFKLPDILGWDGVALTSADFGTRAFGAFLSSDRTQMEIFEWSPSTVGDTSITILYRGLKFDGTQLTEVTANKRDWSSGSTTVQLGADIPQLLALVVDTVADQTVGGVKTFSSTPKSTAGLPTLSTELATKQYVDNTATGTTYVNRVVVAAVAGETIVAGNLVYKKEADGEWYKCDADTAATVDNINLGIAQGGGTDGVAITNGVLIYGLDSNQSGLTANTVYYVSNTAGAISTTPGTVEVTVGMSESTTSLLFSPRYNQQITENQQDALAGTSGIPSSSNKYVTADDVSDAAVSGKIVRASGTALPSLDGSPLTGSPSKALLGTGSDGTVNINSGSFSSGPITSNALTRDAYFANLTLSGGNLNTNGYKIFVSGTLTTNASYKVHALPIAGGNGSNGGASQNPGPTGAAGGTAGGAMPSGTVAGSLNGKNGSAGGNGSNTGTPTQGTNGLDGAAQTYSITSADGTAGGNGGGTATGGAGGTATDAKSYPYNAVIANLMYEITGDAAFARFQTSASSGSGAGGKGGTGSGGESPYYGGAGGGGGASGTPGGIVVIFAKNIVNNGSIEAHGGAGGNGGNGGNGTGAALQPGSGGGGGAGGSGGTIVLVYASLTGSGTITATGGAAGAAGAAGTGGPGGASNGVAGTAGNAGVIYQITI